MSYRRKLFTARGYDLFEVASALQKTIRRSDKRNAAYFALELFESGFHNYCWKRLLTIAAEDVETPVAKEVASLHYGFNLVNTPKKDKARGRIFITKAVFVLCESIKSRETDHFQNFCYDKMVGMSEDEISSILDDVRKTNVAIPDYAYDVHTMKGKRSGKTKADFFLEEQDGLFPKGKDEFYRDMMRYIEAI